MVNNYVVDSTSRDWLFFADLNEARKEFDAGPQDLTELRPGVWGIPGVAIVCTGDVAQMRKVQKKRFYDKFHSTGCPFGHYDVYPALPSVAERIGRNQSTTDLQECPW